MKSLIAKMIVITMCATLSMVGGIGLLILAEVGWNNGFIAGVLLLLLAVTLFRLVSIYVSELFRKIHISELEARIEQINKLQKLQNKIYGQSNA